MFHEMIQRMLQKTQIFPILWSNLRALSVVGYNPYPDEKGTESYTKTLSRSAEILVTIPTPMKRGLKA